MALREVIARLGYKVDKSSEGKVQSSVKGLLGSVKGLVATFGLAFGATELVRGFKSMIELASDASESTNQLNAIFGETADTVAAGMSRIARETGRSEFEMIKFGASMGALLKPLLGSAEGAAAMSEDVVALTADMSSFFNITQEQALEKFRAGLIGSSEPLISLGIDVREAALAQFALSKGITKSTKDMTTAEKTALRFELIASKLGETGAIGDAARTSREGANAFRAVGQATRDLGTRLGQFFLPAATDAANAMTDFVRGLNESIRSGGKLAKFMWFAVNVTKALGSAFAFLADQAQRFAIPLAIIAALLFPSVAMFLLLGAAISLVADDLQVMGEGGESVIGTLITGFQTLKDETGSIFSAITEMIAEAVTSWVEQFGLFEGATEKINRGLDDLRTALEFLTKLSRLIGDINLQIATGGAAGTGQQVIEGGVRNVQTLMRQSANINVVVQGAESAIATAEAVGAKVNEAVGNLFRSAANAVTVASGD